MKALVLIITLFFACGADKPIEKHIKKKLPDRICEPYKSVEGSCDVVYDINGRSFLECHSGYLCYLCSNNETYCDASTD